MYMHDKWWVRIGKDGVANWASLKQLVIQTKVVRVIELVEHHELEGVGLLLVGGCSVNGFRRGSSKRAVAMGGVELLLNLGMSVLFKRLMSRGSRWLVLMLSADSTEPGRALATGDDEMPPPTGSDTTC